MRGEVPDSRIRSSTETGVGLNSGLARFFAILTSRKGRYAE
jgi:hypothetical protein